MIGRRLERLAWGVLCTALVSGLCACLGPIDRPTADFTWCPDGRNGQLDYTFSSTSAPVGEQEIVRATWEFGDGTSPVEGVGVAEHRFSAAGSYPVTLTVTDRRAVTGTKTKIVTVEPAAFVDPTWRLTLDYPPTVSGVVGNRSEERLNEVVVQARFYDADGVRLGEGRATVRDLEPGERARFEIETRDFAARVFYASVGIESFVAPCDMHAAVDR